MAQQLGTNGSDVLQGTDENDMLAGEGGRDNIIGGGGDDFILGGGGNDQLQGNEGADTMFGASSFGGEVDLSKFRIGEDVTGKVTFLGESAGYKNVLGVYKIAADGTIYDTQVLFANASLKGSGGNLVSGQSSVDLDLEVGDQLGFFVVANGYSQRGMSRVLNSEEGNFKFVDAEGNTGNVNNGGGLKLVHVAEDGRETDIKSQYGTSVFHSQASLNDDGGYEHVKAEVNVMDGTVKIGFEDLWRGGDKDFDDSVFVIDMGQTNAALLPRAGESNSASTDDDIMSGGVGDDDMYGMRGNDLVDGGEGNDRVWGNSGDDRVAGGAGDDQVRGGSGNDFVDGGEGNDLLAGNSGNDMMHGGAGNDSMEGNSGNDIMADGEGNDKVSGGSGDDRFVAGAGDDVYRGDSGFDTIDYTGAAAALDVDLSKHVVTGHGTDELWGIESLVGSTFADNIKGDKRDNTIDGGAGDDVIRGLGGEDKLTGNAGGDRFVWLTKDVVFNDQHLGVDTITDLSFEEGDVLDLRKVVDGEFEQLDEVVQLTDGENGTMLSVKVGERFVDVAMLEGVHNLSVGTLEEEGFILA